jgi:xanthine dehydrogenase accessory factor
MNPGFLTQLMAARAAKRPVALITRLSDGAQALIGADIRQGDLELSAVLNDELEKRLANTQSGALDQAGDIFARIYAPAPRLLIVGAVHISQALAPMATMAGYEVTIIDPRSAFASTERFPDVTITNEWPDEAMTRLAPDAQTAVVTLTHDPKLDDPGLAAALTSPAFYIGALGSRRTHEKRITRLNSLGLESQICRIHAPIGLDLGGRFPTEIAVSILAQIIRVRHKGTTL